MTESMMRSVRDHVRTEFAALDLAQLMTRPTSALLGVSQEAAAALAQVGVSTVFDLGSSWLFANARAATAAGASGTATSRFGRAPSDWLAERASYSSLESIAKLPLTALRGMTESQGKALEKALDVHTIRDFAHWPPYTVAHRLVGNASGGTVDPDLEQTEALRPRFGEYPTERVYYSTLVMLQTEAEVHTRDIAHAPLSVMPAIEHQRGPGKPAVGALLTMSQSWYAQGITLGHLLHSLALAPGEATRLAVVDWSRRSRASDTEAVGEQEGLDNAMDHGRAISEVQNAVADEMQSGGSHTHSTARSKSSSMQASAGTGLLTSLVASGDVSGTTETASTEADATSSSWSTGNRSVLGQMAQQVNDRTEQHATSVRNRRASAVSEVGDAGHNQVSTRIVANYNHMHALTVQYYETVQVYRVATQLHRAERCLFVPMEQLDFSGTHGMELVERFRGPLVRSALNRQALSLLLDQHTAVAVTPEVRTHVPVVRALGRRRLQPHLHAASTSGALFGGLRSALRAAKAHPAAERTTIGGLEAAIEAAQAHHADGHGFLGSVIESALHAARAHPGAEHRSLDAVHAALEAARVAHAREHRSAGHARTAHVWHETHIARLSHLLGRLVVRPGSHALHLPDDTELHGISFEGLSVRGVHIDRIGTAADKLLHVSDRAAEIEVHPAPTLAEMSAIALTKHDSAPASGTMILHLAHLGRHFSSPPIPVSLAGGAGTHRVVAFQGESEDRKRELIAHLTANRAHYSHAIFRALDPATILTMLSQYSWNGKPLADQVEPRPVTVSGNYLVLRASVEQSDGSGVKDHGQELSWGELLHTRGVDFGQSDQRLVPIPTAGVYAEAVLGRSNSAEKLDITRFWNWSDSPIPLAPPEISPVSTTVPESTLRARPSPLGAPMLTPMTPAALPDPAGLGAVMQAVASGNMFRDMSGLAGTQELAQAGIKGTMKAATDAAQIASANMRTEAQKAVAMGQIAADLAKTFLTGRPSSGSTQGISGEGARINQGADLDSRGVPGPTGQLPYTVAPSQAGGFSSESTAGTFMPLDALGADLQLASLTDGGLLGDVLGGGGTTGVGGQLGGSPDQPGVPGRVIGDGTLPSILSFTSDVDFAEPDQLITLRWNIAGSFSKIELWPGLQQQPLTAQGSASVVTDPEKVMLDGTWLFILIVTPADGSEPVFQALSVMGSGGDEALAQLVSLSSGTAMNSPSAVASAFGAPTVSLVSTLGTPAVLASTGTPAGSTVALWKDLVSLRPPTSVQSAIRSRDPSWFFHRLEGHPSQVSHGGGDINLDFYPVVVTTMPDKPGGGKYTPEEWLEYFRTHINDFVDTSKALFIPYSTRYSTGTADASWTSPPPAPLGTVVSIKITPDNGSVCSARSRAEEWVFSTLHTTRDGDHPVSGNRQFGFILLENGDVVYFTRGSDRATGILNNMPIGNSIVFAGGHALWLTFQAGMKAMVESRGGSAVIKRPYSNRVWWPYVQVIAHHPTVLWI